MSLAPNETQTTTDICRQMNVVRCNLGEDVEGLVESAQTLTDWRYYVKTYPWICLTGAAALGYLVVPKKTETISTDAETLAKLAKQTDLILKANPTPKKSSGVGGLLFSLLADVAIRGATQYVRQNAGKLLSGDANQGRHDAESNP